MNKLGQMVEVFDTDYEEKRQGSGNLCPGLEVPSYNTQPHFNAVNLTWGRNDLVYLECGIYEEMYTVLLQGRSFLCWAHISRADPALRRVVGGGEDPSF